MKRLLIILFCLLPSGLSQRDLSTPGSESVIVNFSSFPISAEVYISGVFIDRTPVSVRVNANEVFAYRLRVPDPAYKEQVGTLTPSRDVTLNIPIPSTNSLSKPQSKLSKSSPDSGNFRGYSWGTQKDKILTGEIGRSTFLTSFDDEQNGLLYETEIEGYSVYIAFYFSATNELIYASYLFKNTSEIPQDTVKDFQALHEFLIGIYGTPVVQEELAEAFRAPETLIVHSLSQENSEVIHKIFYMSEEYYDQTQAEQMQKDEQTF